MNEQFDQCDAYYRQVLPQMKLRFQLVDAHYYLGMIAFRAQRFRRSVDTFQLCRLQCQYDGLS